MTPFIYALALTILVSMSGLAGLASQDNTSAQTEQAAKPAEDQGHTTVIGCLSGPDKNGKYTLRSMSQRTGVEVFGPEDLKSASGSKVKLTGSWKPGDQPVKAGSEKKNRKFEATDLEVMGTTCEAPSQKTPISKEKQQREQQKQIEQQIEQQQHQQQQQKQDSGTNPPTSGDTSNPK